MPTSLPTSAGEALCEYLHQERGLSSKGLCVRQYPDGSWSVTVDYLETEVLTELRKLSPNGGFPTNSSGETYGNSYWIDCLGYEPDLIAVGATNGESGYARREELELGFQLGYPCEIGDPDASIDYTEWCKDQPLYYYIPVYDVEGKTKIGEFEIYNSQSRQRPQEEIEEELKQMEEDVKRRGLSDEEVEQYVRQMRDEYAR